MIYNIQSHYAVGDELRINCTSFDSRPAARLHWLVNGQLVKKSLDLLSWRISLLGPCKLSICWAEGNADGQSAINVECALLVQSSKFIARGMESDERALGAGGRCSS